MLGLNELAPVFDPVNPKVVAPNPAITAAAGVGERERAGSARVDLPTPRAEREKPVRRQRRTGVLQDSIIVQQEIRGGVGGAADAARRAAVREDGSRQHAASDRRRPP